MSLTASVMKAEAVKKDPVIVQELFSATLEMTNVAKIASLEPTRDVETSQNDNRATPFQEEEYLANVLNSTSWASASSDSNITAPVVNGMTQEWKSGVHNSSLLSSQAPESGIFGNGWFGLMPSLPNIRSRDTSPDDPEGGFAFTLIQTTLNLIYDSLVHDSSSSMALKICRLALRMYWSPIGTRRTTSMFPYPLNTNLNKYSLTLFLSSISQ